MFIMRYILFLSSVVFALSCNSSDPTIKLQEREADPLVIFSSAPSQPAAQLRLLADSTFRLRASKQPPHTAELQGKFSIDDQYYRLFFKDSVHHLNELITPVHPDGSVVVYPDHSVALDRSLLQFYVQGELVAKDTTLISQ